MAGKPKSETPKPAFKEHKQTKEERERDLEEGLDDTFPGSDPVAAIEPAPDDGGDADNKKK
jgi:hypothetical protein